MKKTMFFLCLLTLHNSCSQLKIRKIKNNKKKENMEYFDIDKYKDWEIDTDWTSRENDKFLKKGNERIRVIFKEETIQTEKNNLLNPYGVTKVYYLKNKSLCSVLNEFYKIHLNKYIKYDESGKIVKEINFDKFYVFSLKDLLQKIKREYDIDLEDKLKGAWANRWIDENLKKPFYEVHLKSKENDMKRDYILIDGISGETSFTTSYYMKDQESITPFEQYLLILKKEETEDNSYYKTYKGKDYTKKEWEAFEEEWYKNYKENKNKGFWDDIFPGRNKK